MPSRSSRKQDMSAEEFGMMRRYFGDPEKAQALAAELLEQEQKAIGAEAVAQKALDDLEVEKATLLLIKEEADKAVASADAVKAEHNALLERATAEQESARELLAAADKRLAAVAKREAELDDLLVRLKTMLSTVL